MESSLFYYISYMAFFGNLEAGCRLVDNHDQLRIAMFLCHGLLLNGIIESGQIPFLDIMMTYSRTAELFGRVHCRVGESWFKDFGHALGWI